MSWRTVVITSRCKLDLSMGYLEVRTEETKKIHLSEIHTLIVESTAVSLTAGLLCELANRKIKVIFCDERRNPQTELTPYNGTVDTPAKIRQQMRWTVSAKEQVWQRIVVEKIRNQQKLLIKTGNGACAERLGGYAEQVSYGDITNREGAAARLYFSGLFGGDFYRGGSDGLNAALNYGYTILLSCFNREIVAAGYITQLGIFHDNMFNAFNLGCDLMEPFRPLVDELVYALRPEQLEKEEKHKLIGLMNHQVLVDGNRHYLTTAIRLYTRSVLEALNQGDPSEIRFWTEPPNKKKLKTEAVTPTAQEEKPT